MTILPFIGQIPVISGFTRRFFLTEQVSLLQLADDELHGVSELMLREAPEPVYFSKQDYGAVIDSTRNYLREDPYRFAGFPEVDPRDRFEGGMTAIQSPSTGLVYLPPQRFQCSLRGAFLNLDNGGICTARSSMVRECAPRNRRGSRLKTMWFYGSLKPNRATRVKGICTTVWGKWARHNYYHWLIVGLPRIAHLRELCPEEQVTLLIPKNIPQVWMDSLACCLPEQGVKVQQVDGWVQMDRFEFISIGVIHPVAYLPDDERNHLRESVFNRFGLGTGAGAKRRIYISRSAAMVRRVVNEQEVVRVLEAYGFECIHAERLSFEMQVRLFHSAEFIVGVHGAGLTNILWSGQAKVLEIFPAGKFKPLYFFLAASLGQNYGFMVGDIPSRLEDFYIDTSELREKLERMLSEDRRGSGFDIRGS